MIKQGLKSDCQFTFSIFLQIPKDLYVKDKSLMLL